MTSEILPDDRPINHPFLTGAQRELLAVVLDRIVPPQGSLPGAGSLGLAAFVENTAGRTPQQRRLLNDGLTQIELTATQRSGVHFIELDPGDQVATLRDVEGKNAAFFDTLVRQCYNGYYTNPQIQDLVGHQRPTPTEYVYQPLNEGLLEPQRQRPPFWTQI